MSAAAGRTSEATPASVAVVQGRWRGRARGTMAVCSCSVLKCKFADASLAVQWQVLKKCVFQEVMQDDLYLVSPISRFDKQTALVRKRHSGLRLYYYVVIYPPGRPAEP